MSDLKQYITNIPDFPEKGIIFRDITSLLQSPEGFHEAIDELRKRLDGVEFNTVAGLDARGFLFASPVAYAENKGLILVRKKGKLPRETVSQTYALEYGSAEAELHTDSVKPGDKVVIIDDLIATGGTLEAAVKLVEQLGGKVVKILSIIELTDLKGREKLLGYDVESLISYSGK
jgi:adenine phosphoribosyltransferase